MSATEAQGAYYRAGETNAPDAAVVRRMNRFKGDARVAGITGRVLLGVAAFALFDGISHLAETGSFFAHPVTFAPERMVETIVGVMAAGFGAYFINEGNKSGKAAKLIKERLASEAEES